MVLNFIF